MNEYTLLRPTPLERLLDQGHGPAEPVCFDYMEDSRLFCLNLAHLEINKSIPCWGIKIGARWLLSLSKLTFDKPFDCFPDEFKGKVLVLGGTMFLSHSGEKFHVGFKFTPDSGWKECRVKPGESTFYLVFRP